MRAVRRSFAVLFLVTFALSAPALPDDDAASRSRLQDSSAAAAEVERLHELGDRDALSSLASEIRVDPWLVADELCARGAIDAAEAYADLAPAGRAGRLAELVRRERAEPTEPARRTALRAAAAASARGQPDESIRIIDAAGELRDDVTSIRLLHQRAIDVGRLGDASAALDALRDVADRAQSMGWPTREALVLEYAAGQAERMSALDVAEGLWAQVAELYASFPAPGDEGRARWGGARVLFSEDRIGEAVAAMRLAVRRLHQGDDDRSTGAALSTLAWYEHVSGDLARAMNDHEDALRILADVDDTKAYVQALLTASRTAARAEGVDAAIALVEQALSVPGMPATVDTSGPLAPLALQRARGLVSLAEFHSRKGAVDAALASVAEAVAVFRAARDASWAARAEGLQGKIQLSRCDTEAARAAFERALAIGVATDVAEIRIAASIELGRLAFASAAFGEAEERFRAALEDAEHARDATSLWLSHAEIAKVLLATGRHDGALREARIADRLVRKTVRRLGADASQIASTDIGVPAETGLAAARAIGDVSAWFEFAESGRATALSESVGGQGALRSAAVSDTLVAEADTARAELAQAVAATAAARETGMLAATRSAVAEESAARERLRVALDRIERRRKVSADLEAPEPPVLDDVRERLGPARALVEFHIGEQTAEALVVETGGARLVELGPSEALVAICEAVRFSGDETAAKAARTALVDVLGLGREVRTLLLVPDGSIATVPFAWIAPAYDVAVLPSALVWTLLDDARGERGDGVLAVGDPDYTGEQLGSLPATRAEAEAVGTRVLVGAEATEAAVRRAMVESPRWHAIHFACHGVVNRNAGSLSGLALTRSGTDDGMFTAREILGLPVPADVVVLSACEAGRAGTSSTGTSAAVGLPPAFLAAGCARVVANLWRVDDEAARAFSVAFHSAWAEERATAAGALRTARDAVRSDPRFADPRHWAGWMLWGLPD